MAAAKFAVGIAIGSLALISEALHSSVDVVATVITWLVVRVSDQPADEEHHYGHGKFESLSALFVIALLYVLAGGILVEILEPPARGRSPADALGDPLRGAGDRYRGEFLARAGAASHGARDPKPGAGGGRAAFRLRRARLHRRHHRAGADRPRLSLGRLGRRHRGRRDDIDPGPAARALHHRNAARSCAGGRCRKRPSPPSARCPAWSASSACAFAWSGRRISSMPSPRCRAPTRSTGSRRSRRPRRQRSARRSATPTSPSPRCRSRATMRACASASW